MILDKHLQISMSDCQTSIDIFDQRVLLETLVCVTAKANICHQTNKTSIHSNAKHTHTHIGNVQYLLGGYRKVQLSRTPKRITENSF